MDENDKSFVDMVWYFWVEKGDPTRYTDWDAARCQRLMPDFYHAWTLCNIYERLADDAGRRESEQS